MNRSVSYYPVLLSLYLPLSYDELRVAPVRLGATALVET